MNPCKEPAMKAAYIAYMFLISMILLLASGCTSVWLYVMPVVGLIVSIIYSLWHAFMKEDDNASEA